MIDDFGLLDSRTFARLAGQRAFRLLKLAPQSRRYPDPTDEAPFEYRGVRHARLLDCVELHGATPAAWVAGVRAQMAALPDRGLALVELGDVVFFRPPAPGACDWTSGEHADPSMWTGNVFGFALREVVCELRLELYGARTVGELMEPWIAPMRVPIASLLHHLYGVSRASCARFAGDPSMAVKDAIAKLRSFCEEPPPIQGPQVDDFLALVDHLWKGYARGQADKIDGDALMPGLWWASYKGAVR